MCQSFSVSSQILTLSSCDPPIWWKSLHIFHLQNKNHSQKWWVFKENHSSEAVMPVVVIPNLSSPLQAKMQPSTETDLAGIQPLPAGHCASLSAGRVLGQPALLQGLPSGSGQSALQAAHSGSGNHTPAHFPFTWRAALKRPCFLHTIIPRSFSILT